jgi:hypothetical protein
MEVGGVSLSAQDLFVAAVHDGHRALYRSAAVAFFGFVLVAAVYFLRAV